MKKKANILKLEHVGWNLFSIWFSILFNYSLLCFVFVFVFVLVGIPLLLVVVLFCFALFSWYWMLLMWRLLSGLLGGYHVNLNNVVGKWVRVCVCVLVNVYYYFKWKIDNKDWCCYWFVVFVYQIETMSYFGKHTSSAGFSLVELNWAQLSWVELIAYPYIP